jgi:hypothetical protein
MPIKIIDNFRLNSAKPIDDRIVVGDNNRYTNRESIELKYIGLRVWDINESKTFVWNGNSWILDSGSSGSSGVNGTTNYIPKFNSSTTISNSIIYEVGGRIGINKTNPSSELDVNGDITAININANIRADRVTAGNLPLARLSGGGDNTLLVGTSGAAQWRSIEQVLGDYSGSSLPVGAIILWSSAILPTGFVLCDGSQYTVNGNSIVTPDLSGSFIKASADGVSDLGERGEVAISGSGKSYVLNYIMYVGTVDNIRGESEPTTTTTTEEPTTTTTTEEPTTTTTTTAPETSIIYGGININDNSRPFAENNICDSYSQVASIIEILGRLDNPNLIKVDGPAPVISGAGTQLPDGFYSYSIDSNIKYFEVSQQRVTKIEDCGSSNLVYGGSSFIEENICSFYGDDRFEISILNDLLVIGIEDIVNNSENIPLTNGFYSYSTDNGLIVRYFQTVDGKIVKIDSCRVEETTTTTSDAGNGDETTTTSTTTRDETTTTTELVEETTTTTRDETTTTTELVEETTTTTELVEETTTTTELVEETTTTERVEESPITLYGPYQNSEEACNNNLIGPSIQINNVVFNIGVTLINLESNEINSGYYTYGDDGEYINYQLGGGIQEINSCLQ